MAGAHRPATRSARSTCRATPAGWKTRSAGRRKAANKGAAGVSRYHFGFRPSERTCFMLPEQQQQLISHIEAAVRELLPAATAAVVLERPKVAAHGDIACNVAMQLAKAAKRN